MTGVKSAANPSGLPRQRSVKRFPRNCTKRAAKSATVSDAKPARGGEGEVPSERGTTDRETPAGD
jgi:hypothetical protein